jgi:hypothetical protein
MTLALDRSRYQLGTGMVSPDRTRFLITIPKNASSMLASWSGENGWEISNIKDHSSLKEVLIPLRDPVDRWVSGISQYINTYILHPHGPNGPVFPGELITNHDASKTADQFIDDYNYLVERLLLDVIDRFDDHVYEQSGYLQGLDFPDKLTFFLVDPDMITYLSGYLGWRDPINVNDNSGSSDQDICTLQNFFKNRLLDRPELTGRLRKHYIKDYQLLSRT